MDAEKIKTHRMPNTFKRPYYVSINGKNLISEIGQLRRFQTEQAAAQAGRFAVALSKVGK